MPTSITRPDSACYARFLFPPRSAAAALSSSSGAVGNRLLPGAPLGAKGRYTPPSEESEPPSPLRLSSAIPDNVEEEEGSPPDKLLRLE